MKRLTIIFLLFCLLGGCQWQQNVTKRSEIEGKNTPYEIAILTVDSTLYKLNSFILLENTINGKGTSVKNGVKKEFAGELKFKDMIFIKSSQTNLLKMALAAGVVGLVGAAAISSFNTSAQYNINESKYTYYPKSGNWSCPFIYAFDGYKYNLVSETFSGAVFSGAERSSFDILTNIIPCNNKYVFKIINERNETDNINLLKLYAVDVPNDASIVADITGNVHTVIDPVPPINCTDRCKNNVLQYVLKRDGNYCESDLSDLNINDNSSLKDELTFEFVKPAGTEKMKLVIAAKNTNLGIFAFDNIFKLRGDNWLLWYGNLEKNNTDKNKMLSWMKREGMLHIKLWQNGSWNEITALPEVGPAIQKAQAVVINLKEIKEKQVKIKLESSADLWMIDQVYADYSEDIKLKITEAGMVSAFSNSGVNVGALIRNEDSRYLTTLPGDTTNVEYQAVPETAGMKRYYMLKSKGYYHLWIDSEGKDQAELHNRILTEPLYGSKVFMQQWKEIRASKSGK